MIFVYCVIVSKSLHFHPATQLQSFLTKTGTGVYLKVPVLFDLKRCKSVHALR